MTRHVTHYPGMGLTAPVEAFNAYKLWHRRQAALTPADYVAYDKLVQEHKASEEKANHD